ncbi:MAG TPA: hypothetical protein DEP72_05445 [Clostridiales bacterium]|nr:MAG: hypothetical protein A2Y18_08480 [Clostridiales bacterium GWD2_32_19]HCC07586.1 hypothetical protein [Clostridiales bacterium]
MTNTERKLVDKLMAKSISNEDFKRNFTVDVLQNPYYIMQILEIAYIEKELHDVESALFVGFVFNLFTEDFVEILCKLIEEPWHYQHEDIARLLQKLKSPQTVECLYKTALTQFEYLEFDEAFALAVKCIWALGDINTPKSREKLELLTQSDNEIIRDNAINQLDRISK